MKVMTWSLYTSAVLLCVAAMPAHAGFLLNGSGGGPFGSFGSQGNGTAGFGFSITGPSMQVTALGIWDENGDGLAQAHEVGLWNSTGTLLASVVVPSGTAATLVGEFRYVDLASPVMLQTNQTYVLGAHYQSPADVFRLDNNADMPPLFSPGVTFEQPRSNGGFTFPNPTLGTFTDVGPNLEFSDPAAVPEPSGLVLAGFGLAGLLAYQRRRSAGARK